MLLYAGKQCRSGQDEYFQFRFQFRADDEVVFLIGVADVFCTTASYIFMIRPRRFGKSLFLSIMKAYYDILQKDRFESYSADYGLVRIPPTSATVSR